MMRPQVIYRYERSLPPRYAWLAHWPPWLVVKWAFTALVLNYMAMSFLVRTAKRLGFWKSPQPSQQEACVLLPAAAWVSRHQGQS